MKGKEKLQMESLNTIEQNPNQSAGEIIANPDPGDEGTNQSAGEIPTNPNPGGKVVNSTSGKATADQSVGEIIANPNPGNEGTDQSAGEMTTNPNPGGKVVNSNHGEMGIKPSDREIKIKSISIWNINWNLLSDDLKYNWKFQRSWKKIIFIVVSFLYSTLDLGSDILVANSFLNGQSYTSVQNNRNQTINNCTLISHTITNLTTEDKISESFR